MADFDDLNGLLTGGLLSPEDLAAANAMAGQGQQDNSPMVWLPGQKQRGTKTATFQRGEDLYGHGAKVNEVGPSSSPTADSVSAWVYDPEKRKKIEDYLRKRGIEVTGFDDLEKIWQTAVGRASDAFMNSGGSLKKSPWDMLDLISPPEETGPKPVKGLEWNRTSENVDMAEMPPEMVRQGITSMLQDILGRGPTDSEVNDFAARASAVAAENPYTQTTTSHMKWDQDLEQYVDTGSTTQESGVSQEELNAKTQGMVQDEVSNTNEAHEFGYVRGINVLMDMLGGG